MATVTLTARPLTKDEFTPFGDVIETADSEHWTINQGFAERYHDLARIDVGAKGGRPLVNLFRAKARNFPMPVRLMERHPLASQAFVPLNPSPFLIIVARPGDAPRPEDLVAFVSAPGQGVNYARGVWHHPLIAIGGERDFLVVDRGGPEENYDEVVYAEGDVELTFASAA
jgi:ureidoglycolate lyase